MVWDTYLFSPDYRYISWFPDPRILTYSNILILILTLTERLSRDSVKSRLTCSAAGLGVAGHVRARNTVVRTF